jgi:putative restriction endonuclease
MPRVTFDKLTLGATYSRPFLSRLWGYKGYQAIARGVVTPHGHKAILLFVTREKQSAAEPYDDRLESTRLHWEGPTDHFAEQRMLQADSQGDEIHLFHRDRHHSDFAYLGRLRLVDTDLRTQRPSRFTFELLDYHV